MEDDMDIELKTSKDKKNAELLNEYYETFKNIFYQKQGKELIRNNFSKTDSKLIEKDILSFSRNGQISCGFDWGKNGKLIFQIDLLYFKYKFKENTYNYQIGYQFQDSTIKVNCAKYIYMDSIIDEIKNIIPIFEKYKDTSFFNGRLGTPRRRAYISITKKLDNIKSLSIKDKCEKLYQILEDNYYLIKEIKKDIEDLGGVFYDYNVIK